MNSVSTTTISDEFNKRSYLVDFLAILFGISSWIELNGLWVEMPILVQKLPESWNLASYIIVITQVANLGPICYTLACKRWSSKVLEKPVIHVTLAVGCMSSFFLMFFWSKTSSLFGSQHSTALLTLTFILAFVDCTSSVLYLPFMANYKEKYVISYLIGEGMSGLLPGLVALVQGVGGPAKCRLVNQTDKYNNTTAEWEQYTKPPLFSVEIFFGFLCVMMIISWLAFVLLQVLPQAKSEKVYSTTKINTSNPNMGFDNNQAITSSSDFSNYPPLESDTTDYLLQRKSLSRKHFVILLAFQAFSCALTIGILPPIQTYSCLPYGNIAYHLAVTLSSISNPLACFVAMLLPSKTLPTISIYLTFGTAWACYIMSAAVLSPQPPMVGTLGGEVVIVISWICFVGLMSYVKACATAILREKGGHSALFWLGGFTQIGSASGALVMFVIVNFTKTFKSYSPC